MWKKLSAAQRVAVVASAAAAAVWTAVWVAPSDDGQQAAPAHEAAPAQQAAPASEPTAAPAREPEAQPAQPAPRAAEASQDDRQAHTVHAAPASQQPTAADQVADRAAEQAALAAFREGMASDNAGTRIAALRKLEEDGTTQALPELLARDLAPDPDIAPTLIQVSAKLAQRSPRAERGVAAEQLSSWLQTEAARDGNDARGNVSLLVESLSSLNTQKTQPALIGVLQNDKLPLNVQTLAIDGLSHFSNPESKAALEQFRAQLAQGKREGFELELQREAEQAADRALARVSR